MKRHTLISLFSLLGIFLVSSGQAKTIPYSNETTSFSVRVNDQVVPYRIFAFFFLPGESAKLTLGSVETQLPLRMESDGGTQHPLSPTAWTWEAPKQPGLYPIRFIRSDTGETLVLNAFVMRPYQEVKNGILNGYRIGNYPAPFSQQYQLPRGFIEVTAQTENALVSPHFQLKQFLCKQAGGYPKYLVLRETLVQKLERTLAAVNRKGYHYSGFHIMSGYRTPYYNASLGNVKFSRHMLGEAADILFDGAANHTINAASFFKLVDQSQRDTLGGGLGKYPRTSNHGPFVHVDVRPGIARWEG